LRIAPPDQTGLLFYERRMMRQEPAVHGLVLARTSIPAPRVVAHDFTRALMDRDYLIMTALPGVPLSQVSCFTTGQYAEALRQTGRYLRQLHALTAPACLGIRAYGYLGDHRPMPPQPGWAEAFHLMWNKLLDDVQACGCYDEHEAGAIRELFDRHRRHFERPVEPSLLHMDVWSENILVDSEGNVTGLVDFDRALWGDVEIEYAVLDYCGISEAPFWEGYGAERDLSPPARVRRLFYLLYELQKYMPIRVWRRRDPAAAARYKQQALALLSHLGLRL